MSSHASNPVAQHRHGDVYRIYFGSRDRLNRSAVGYVDIELGATTTVLGIAERPVVSPGEPGLFDDSGTSMGCLVAAEGKSYLYYVGWNLGVTVPWRNSIGLAISDGPDKPFRKHSRAPVVDRNHHDPFSLSYPWVLREKDRWRMWYGSNVSWGKGKDDMLHVIKYAESEDGIHWEREGRIAIDLRGDEIAVSRPSVVEDGGRYRMWYSYRGETYRIGYAESADGKRWTRLDDHAGIEPSEVGWDSESIEYPSVFARGGRRYMLYNGNGYGATGVGLAVFAA